MKASAKWIAGSQTFQRPNPCLSSDCHCKYCEHPEFDCCEYDHCEFDPHQDRKDAPQWWRDEWKQIAFMGYYHEQCGEYEFNSGPKE